MIKLAKNYKVLHKSWSVRLSLFLAVASFIEFTKDDLLSAVQPFFPSEYFSLLVGIFSLIIGISRFIYQPAVSNALEQLTGEDLDGSGSVYGQESEPEGSKTALEELATKKDDDLATPK